MIVQTRWSESDLVGQVLDNEAEVDEADREGWHVVDLPAICECYEDRPPLPGDVTVEEDWREPGEALCPERYDMRALSKIRAAVGSREFASLYQQSPRAAGGNIIDPNWFQFYTQAPEKFSRIIMSADCTFTASDTSDYVAISIIGETGGRYYLLDMVNERMDIIGTMARMQAKVRQWAPSAVLVEAAANGHAVMQMMRQKIPNMIGIKPAQGGSKTTRVQAIAPIIEAGNFYIPQRATWVEPFVSQCALFPASKNDDMIDSVSQALNWSTRRPEFKSTVATYGYGARAKVAGPKIDGFE